MGYKAKGAAGAKAQGWESLSCTYEFCSSGSTLYLKESQEMKWEKSAMSGL